MTSRLSPIPLGPPLDRPLGRPLDWPGSSRAAVGALGAALVALSMSGCGRQPICVPACMDRVCGEDGCGGSCGACDPDQVCAGGQCLCVPDCAGRWCGDDGCGGSCGECPTFTACEQGTCVCAPTCVDESGEFIRTCGGDGCGGSCGLCATGEICRSGTCCAPDCFGRQCGDDGCGGICGTCPPGTSCLGGGCACQPQCEERQCGGDGCGGSCGQCGAGELCLDGVCCAPDCAGRWCGDDGCGGSCGDCRQGMEECVTGPGPVVAACSAVDAQCDALASPGGAKDQCVTDQDCAAGQVCVSVCGVRACTCSHGSDCAAPTSVCRPAVWHAYPALQGPGLWTCAAPCDSQVTAPDTPCPAGAHCQPMYAWLDGAAAEGPDGAARDVCANPLRMDCLSCSDDRDCVSTVYECVRAEDATTGICLRPCDPGCPDGTQCELDWQADREACFPHDGPCSPN